MNTNPSTDQRLKMLFADCGVLFAVMWHHSNEEVKLNARSALCELLILKKSLEQSGGAA